MYPPFRDELPTELYGPPHLNEEYEPYKPPAEFIRIAKNEQKIFGIYELDRLDRGIFILRSLIVDQAHRCLLYTSPSPRDKRQSRMPSSA